MQATLKKTTTQKIQGLPPGVIYQEDWVDDPDGLFDELHKLPWDQHQIVMFGKPIPAPRKYAWMGTEPPNGLYGAKLNTVPWSDSVNILRDHLNDLLGVEFDSCNLNLYRNGGDHLGWHIDPEDEGRWDCPIASISLGAERRFEMREYTRSNGNTGKKQTNRSDIYHVTLKNGSLVVMPAGFQRTHLHRVAKQPKVLGPRINLTFRRIN